MHGESIICFLHEQTCTQTHFEKAGYVPIKLRKNRDLPDKSAIYTHEFTFTNVHFCYLKVLSVFWQNGPREPTSIAIGKENNKAKIHKQIKTEGTLWEKALESLQMLNLRSAESLESLEMLNSDV